MILKNSFLKLKLAYISLNYQYNDMIKEVKQKIQGPTKNKYTCSMIQITSQTEFFIVFSALRNLNTRLL